MTVQPLALRFGPFVARLRTDLEVLRTGWSVLYPDQLTPDRETFVDFDVEVVRPFGPRRWYRPQALFKLDGESPFKPLPAAQALSMFEWGLNSCIGGRAHQFLIFHAAAVERGGRVAILPGLPQSGKSTLTAALVHRGWRLLSDELTLLALDDGLAVPLARPIHLKNASIELLRIFAKDAVISPPVHDTIKGTVALLRAPKESVARMQERAPVRWIVFPRWRAEHSFALERRRRSSSFMELGRHGINLSLHGLRGFTMAADLIERCDCLTLRYSLLDDAIAAFDELAAGA